MDNINNPDDIGRGAAAEAQALSPAAAQSAPSGADLSSAAASYVPEPLDTSDVSLTSSFKGLGEIFGSLFSHGDFVEEAAKFIAALADRLAGRAHNDWYASRLAEGADIGKYPNLKPWDELTPEQRSSSLRQAEETLKVIEKRVGLANILDGKGIPSDAVVDAVAANAHEVWARQRMDDGWTYAPVRDNSLKRHPMLVPYDMLPESEKAYDKAYGHLAADELRDTRVRAVLEKTSPERLRLGAGVFEDLVAGMRDTWRHDAFNEGAGIALTPEERVSGIRRPGVDDYMVSGALELAFGDTVDSLRGRGFDLSVGMSATEDGVMSLDVMRRMGDGSLRHACSWEFTDGKVSVKGDEALAARLGKESLGDVIDSMSRASDMSVKRQPDISPQVSEYRRKWDMLLERREALETLYPSGKGMIRDFDRPEVGSLKEYNKAFLEREALDRRSRLTHGVAADERERLRDRRDALDKAMLDFERKGMAEEIRSRMASSFVQVNSEKGTVMRFADSLMEASGSENLKADDFWRSRENCRTVVRMAHTAGVDGGEITDTVSSLSGGSFNERDIRSVMAGVDAGLVKGYKDALASGDTLGYFDRLGSEYARKAADAPSVSEGDFIHVTPESLRSGQSLPGGMTVRSLDDGTPYISGRNNVAIPPEGLYIVRGQDDTYRTYNNKSFKAIFDIEAGKAVRKSVAAGIKAPMPKIAPKPLKR